MLCLGIPRRNMETQIHNITEDTSQNSIVLKTPFWFQVATPVVCIVGLGGNLLNLIVLQRQRKSSGSDSFVILLIAIAVSDMFFCAAVLLSSFLQDEHIVLEDLVPSSLLYKLYFLYYGLAAINLFLMSSTWLVVATAFMRLVGIMAPLNSRSSALFGHKITAVFVVCLSCILLCAPLCSYLEIGEVTIPMPPSPKSNWTSSSMSMLHNDNTAYFKTYYCYYARFSNSTMALFVVYVNGVWPVLASFAPCFALIICNVLLIHRLRMARWARRSICPQQTNSRQGSGLRLTFTLIIMFSAHVILVLPSEVLKYASPYKIWGETGHLVAAVTNFMQTCNFAGNFILYLMTNVAFRKAIERCLESSVVQVQDVVQFSYHRRSTQRRDEREPLHHATVMKWRYNASERYAEQTSQMPGSPNAMAMRSFTLLNA